MVREVFYESIRKLDSDVLEMGAMAAEAVRRSLKAFRESDVELAADVVKCDDDIDKRYLSIESRALGLIATQQPVAKDLRLIVTVFRLINEIERVGDLSLNIAKITMREVDTTGMEVVVSTISELGEHTIAVLDTALESYAKRDMDLAKSLDGLDDKVDEEYKKLLKQLYKFEEESSLETAMNLMLAGRYFERISDHAVNIADRVKYIVTGKLQMPDHHTVEIPPKP